MSPISCWGMLTRLCAWLFLRQCILLQVINLTIWLLPPTWQLHGYPRHILQQLRVHETWLAIPRRSAARGDLNTLVRGSAKM